MRLRLVAGVIAVFIVAGVALGIAFVGPSALSSFGKSGSPNTQIIPTSAPSNPIVQENNKLGTASWKIPANRISTTQIQAYANETSVLPGSSITFYVSTQVNTTPYTLDIYRMGWYQGNGGRLVATIPNLMGKAQGYYDATTKSINDCPTCYQDLKIGLVEADWAPSYVLNVPNDWTTGIYLAKFVDSQNWQTYVPFDVLGNSNSQYVAVTPDTTYAAYNSWGGYSLYDSENVVGQTTDLLGKAVKVSFDKPYALEGGSSQVLIFMLPAIKWMESQGYDLSYISDVDIQTSPDILLHHKAYISLGHDEYWTKEMRDAVDKARNSGVGLAFFGANTGYWQMRFEPNHLGVANRIVVCYKVLVYGNNPNGTNDYARDPFYGKDNSRVTTQFRDPLLNRPENALVGIMFSDLTHAHFGYPWKFTPSANSPLFNGTNLQTGQTYGCGLVGYEWDKVFNNGAQPANLQVLSKSPTINDTNTPDSSNTTYYIASSGAFVFATGGIYWTSALDNYRLRTDPLCTNQPKAVPQIQALMKNVMAQLVVTHYSGQLAALPANTGSANAVLASDFSVKPFNSLEVLYGAEVPVVGIALILYSDYAVWKKLNLVYITTMSFILLILCIWVQKKRVVFLPGSINR